MVTLCLAFNEMQTFECCSFRCNRWMNVFWWKLFNIHHFFHNLLSKLNIVMRIKAMNFDLIYLWWHQTKNFSLQMANGSRCVEIWMKLLSLSLSRKRSTTTNSRDSFTLAYYGHSVLNLVYGCENRTNQIVDGQNKKKIRNWNISLDILGKNNKLKFRPSIMLHMHYILLHAEWGLSESQ